MAWDSMMPTLLRSVIGDTGATQKYTDDDLNNVLLAAAQFVTFRLPLNQQYNIDIESTFITPDPTNTDTRDDAFINLVTLKAACMLMNAEVRVYGQQAIAIRDGTSAIDLKRDLKSLQSLADNFCKELNSAIISYTYNQQGPGEAIVGPYKYGLNFGYTRGSR